MSEKPVVNKAAIYDYCTNIERKIQLIKVLQNEMFRVARRNTDDRDYREPSVRNDEKALKKIKRKEMAFLRIGENTIEKSIIDIEKNITWIMDELKIDQNMVPEQCDCEKSCD